MIVRKVSRVLPRLVRDRAAAAAVEMALAAPFLLALGMAGAEVVNLAILHLRLNQLAITVADNASRAKQSVVGGAPQFREYDVNQVFTGAALSVQDLSFPTRGRVILSSLEMNSSGGQWIHWQRCWGSTAYVSRYGVQGTGKTGTSFAGMGQTTVPMTVDSGNAIMFVEVAYNYTPVFFKGLIKSKVIRKEAALYVRDDRDLNGPSPSYPGIYPTTGITSATC